MTVKFGPSGNSKSFYDEGFKSSVDMPKWLKQKGLDAYEYSFGRGINIGVETAQKIGRAAAENGIALSIHSPYYINFGSKDPEIKEKSINYLKQTIILADKMQADRVVLHPGSVGKNSRDEAFGNLVMSIKQAIDLLKELNLYGKIHICPETMGKKNQLGTLDEILDICQIDETLIPTIDFGHIHALGRGAINSKEDYEYIFNRVENALGRFRLDNLHCHFSRVEFTEAGEKKHWTFTDTQYGPEFEPLAQVLAEREMSVRIICESRENMAEDALKMKKIYNEYITKLN
ncbi:TIM barrel protein [Thermobrachium celere]|uniref:Endonuclease IV n=1 Tax=Thermobrachium celere DSM 8682 TaxID=941824 RepID=R7RSG0_9CLOT|nr:TIM barrel protein [Thermobrachium celere]GFR34252.1 endonuclease IV [Thermobrachium celere]CDF58223.1 Endonuclease IV [Thermobrachium celere DSM 8682]